MEDLSGRVFERLTVISKSHMAAGRKMMWNCVCICGKETKVSRSNLITRHTLSCGCLRAEKVKMCSITHGGRYLPEYSVWCNIKARCYNKACEKYPNYGGRGIKVCGRWLNSFENFLEDMGKRPEGKGYSIERSDVNGDYCPSNCLWINSNSIQCFNQTKRSSNTSGRTGVNWIKARSIWQVNIKKDGKLHYFGRFKKFEDAVERVEQAELQLYGFIRSQK